MGVLNESAKMQVEEEPVEEVETAAEDSDDLKEEEEEEPVLKKVKRDLTKESEQEMESFDEIVNDPDIKFTEKVSKLSGYLESIIENNVNTLEFEKNFNDWMKASLVRLMDEGTHGTIEFYDFLSNVFKVAPIIVEANCEQMLSFIFTKHQFTPENNLGFESFMENLSVTFEKLRRYPKLIAKLLCAVRNKMHRDSKLDEKFLKKMLGFKSKNREIFILPKRFMDSLSTTVSLLPAGQIFDLWKTLQYNLEEECIKPFSKGSTIGHTALLSVIVELTVTFLSSIKVADYSVPTLTVERVHEMMGKLKETCVSKLAELVPTKYDESFVKSFLKLCNAWSNLDHFMGIYNAKYSSSLREAVIKNYEGIDVSYVIPFLSGDEWGKMWSEAVSNEDSTSATLLVNLVGIKLKIFAGMGQSAMKIGENETGNESSATDTAQLEASIENAARFIWEQQEVYVSGNSTRIVDNEDTLRVVTAYLPANEMAEYAREYVSKKISKELSSSLPSPQKLACHVKFRVAVVLELVFEAVHRIGKMASMKRPVKNFLAKTLNESCKLEILKSLEHETFSNQLKDTLKEGVEIVNTLISATPSKNEDSDELSVELLADIVSLINQENLIQCPTPLKTVVCLSFLIVLVALLKRKEELQKDVLSEVITVFSECARHSSGNDVLFHLNWINLYGFVKNTVKFIPESSVVILSDVILENVYISPKIANEFGQKFIRSDAELDFSSAEGHLQICALDVILREATDKKNKSLPVLTSHASSLLSAVLRTLSDGSVISECHTLGTTMKKKRKSFSVQSSSNEASVLAVAYVMRSCFLLQKGKSLMKSEEASDVDVVMLPFMHFAVDFMEASNKILKKGDDPVIKDGLQQSVYFLLEIMKAFREKPDQRSLPEGFLVRLWTVATTSDSTALLKTIFEVSDSSEFEEICSSIIEQLDDPGFVSSGSLSTLIEAEISNDEKKKIRRTTIESSLYKYLQISNAWKNSDQFAKLGVPHLQFQTSLLKRRKPMGSLATMSVCLSSITSFPLERIQPIDEFKSTFSLLCELLNAFNVHRMDVLAFRSHVFLQCFQFLVEHLVKRADQKNDLSDREIYDLRHCAHCIERICQSAKLGKDELGRVSPYLVVVLLRQFEKTTVYPHVKNPLLNGCYKLLDMCDIQGISHVNSMLSAGSREIFKTVYDMYKKFYRYKGKV